MDARSPSWLEPDALLDAATWGQWLDATIVRKLVSHSPLPPADRAVLRGLVGKPRRVGPRTVIVEEGSRPPTACVLLDGVACRFKSLPNRRRQILSVHLPGDVIDLQSALLGTADHGLATISAAAVASLPHDALRAAASASPALGGALWRETLIEAAILREWLLNLGQRDAYARLAHLICEMAVRSAAAGLSRGSTFDLPLTQIELGEATGLSPVHINRTLQRLRSDRLLTLRGAEVQIKSWDGLARAAGFDPAYLHLRQPSEAAA